MSGSGSTSGRPFRKIMSTVDRRTTSAHSVLRLKSQHGCCLHVRPHNGIGSCFLKKRVVVLIVFTVGLTCVTFQGRLNQRSGDGHSRQNDERKIVEGGKRAWPLKEQIPASQSPSVIVASETSQEKTAKDVVRRFDKIIKDSLEAIFQSSNDAPINHSEIESSLLETAQKDASSIRSSDLKDILTDSSVESSLNTLNNKQGVVAQSSSNSINNRQGVMAQSLSGPSDTISAFNTTNVTEKFECPESFRNKDPDLAWFRISVAQKSGKYLVPGDLVDEVLILTPISNVKRHLRKYFENICSLTYPHRHISIVLGEDSSTDETMEAAEELAVQVRSYFRRVEVLKLKGVSSRTSGQARHEQSWQLTRRRHLAMARNQLLFGALRDEKWVLWMDSDIRHISADMVERLLWPGKAIVTVNCLYRMDNGQTDTFDRNTWRDTEASKKRLNAVPEEFLMLEGYEPTQRKTLNDLKEEGDVVRLDGVGGCVLLVSADLHRKGLVFPSFVFDHHVETEGLAKMAARMGIEMYGLPSVNVIHW